MLVGCNRLIGSGNWIKHVLILMVHGSIYTEGKNSTSEEGEEDREVAVGTTYVGGARAVTLST
jgi:hypothetical protein